MISSVAIVFGVSISVFVALLVAVRAEERRGKRYFATRIRAWFDRVIDAIGQRFINGWNHFIKYILQLNWYYSIHSVLRAILRATIAFYEYFENVFERNRSRTRQLKVEKRQLGELNHLRQMAEHKENTALTPAEKKKLRKNKLEDRH